MGGGLLDNETVWRKHSRARDVEEEGRTKTRTPTAHDDDDGHTLLGINGEVEGTLVAPRITAIRQFAHLPLPVPPNTNMVVPCPM